MSGTTMDLLARLVRDEETFYAEQWRRAPGVLRPDHPPLDVLTVAELDRLLDAGLLTAPYAQLVHEDGTVPAARFCTPRVVLGEIADGYVDPVAVRRLIRTERATLLLRYVDQWHAGVRAFTDGLAERFGRQVEAFCFLTPPGSRGRPVHRDDADVFAVQLHGAKRWRVYGGPADGNWQPEREDGDPGPPLLDAVLREGEVLYVPRGFAHAATAEGEGPSVHLSLTVREAGTAQLYALTRALLVGEGAGLPARPNSEEELLATAAGLLDAFARTLDELTAEELVELARDVMRTRREAPERGDTLGELLRGAWGTAEAAK
ncbi:JmjC domain-containing protein [Streptomyces sp. NPDC004111]|uniref:JmjC domain-containing protein n=1 Tax=Streptomyces sp. NPDC004111 TaxID=3364690 RepID=UPI0036B51AAD